jgi:hypothetical protein
VDSGQFGDANAFEIPKAITGVDARIIRLVGKYFPTGGAPSPVSSASPAGTDLCRRSLLTELTGDGDDLWLGGVNRATLHAKLEEAGLFDPGIEDKRLAGS